MTLQDYRALTTNVLDRVGSSLISLKSRGSALPRGRRSMSSANQGEGPTDAEALELSRQRKGKAKAKEKTSLSASISKPRPRSKEEGVKTIRQAWKKTAEGLSEEEQRKAVLQAIEVFKQLPPASQYAQHRLKVLDQVLQLLNKSREERSSEEAGELQQLLQQLKL